MTGSTLEAARAAKACVKARLADRSGVAVGIGASEDASGYAVVVTVEDDAAAAALPALPCKVPLRIVVAGRVHRLRRGPP